MKALMAMFAAGAVAFGMGTAALADDDDVSDEDWAKIQAALTEAQCEVDRRNVEKEDDGYELDDVFCADGQFDVDMDANFKITEKTAE